VLHVVADLVGIGRLEKYMTPRCVPSMKRIAPLSA
jgi:hypothetical protein